MEPVPETSQMDNFHPTPVPTLRIYESSPTTPKQPPTSSPPLQIPNFSKPSPKPLCIRRVTEPALPVPPWETTRQPLSLPPRTTSPFSRGHIRSQSHSASLTALPMSRAKSMPVALAFNSSFAFGITRPGSPAGASSSPSRNRVMRKPADEAFPTTTLPIRSTKLDLGRLDTGSNIDGSIPETGSSIPEEEEETPKAEAADFEPIILPGAPRSASPSLYPGYTAAGYPRQRRPSSPLRNYNYASSSSSYYSTGTGAATPTSPSSIASSPSPLYASTGPNGGGRYDTFSGYNFPPSVSSNPTTPSSLRSRSPSISSLETIPDSPDAEEAAVEAERIARKLRQRQQKDREEDEGGSGSGSDGESVKSGDGVGVMGRGRRGAGSGMGRDKSKRWSVCGAERRQDLDLETIWED